MPALKIYNVFISHVWRKNENSEYYRLVALLNGAPNFMWRNYSVPEHDPLQAKTDKQLREKIDEQVRLTSCFLVISGMYAQHRKWILEEMRIAVEYGKPIISVIPYGQQRIPIEVQNISKDVVGWNTNSIVESIRKYAL